MAVTRQCVPPAQGHREKLKRVSFPEKSDFFEIYLYCFF